LLSLCRGSRASFENFALFPHVEEILNCLQSLHSRKTFSIIFSFKARKLKLLLSKVNFEDKNHFFVIVFGLTGKLGQFV
jgi:hypothetical protein